MRFLNKLYGALPQTPHAFLKKAWEKAFFAGGHPAHSVRALSAGFFLFKNGLLL